MKKLAIVVAAVFLAGTAGMVWAALDADNTAPGKSNMSSGGDRPSESLAGKAGTNGKAGLTLNKSSKNSMKLKNSGKGVTNNLKNAKFNGGVTKGSKSSSGKTSLTNSNNAGLNFTHGANSALSGNTHNGALGGAGGAQAH